MKIGVISDTHDRLATFARAISLFKRMNVDGIFHAGDYIAPFAAKLMARDVLSIETYCVYGNNDGERDGLKGILPNIVDGPLVIELGGRKIVMHHFIDWLKPEVYSDADLVITGHTHEVVKEQKGSTLFLNPGECCGYLTERSTVAIVDLDGLTADIIEVYAVHE